MGSLHWPQLCMHSIYAPDNRVPALLPSMRQSAMTRSIVYSGAVRQGKSRVGNRCRGSYKRLVGITISSNTCGLAPFSRSNINVKHHVLPPPQQTWKLT